MTQKTRLIILLFTFTAFSCRREQIPALSLPSLTQTGQNTLGFLLDNKVWTNYGRRCTFLGGCNDNKVTAEFYKQPNGDFVLSVSAAYNVASQNLDQYFAFSTTNITNTGTVSLDSSAGHQVLFIANSSSQSYKDYTNSLPGKFQLTITRFDTTNKIVSGTFGGVLYHRFNFADSLKLQDGRFDIQLEYIR